MNTLVLHRPEAGDWTVAYLNDKYIYEGHSGLSDLAWGYYALLVSKLRRWSIPTKSFRRSSK